MATAGGNLQSSIKDWSIQDRPMAQVASQLSVISYTIVAGYDMVKWLARQTSKDKKARKIYKMKLEAAAVRRLEYSRRLKPSKVQQATDSNKISTKLVWLHCHIRSLTRTGRTLLFGVIIRAIKPNLFLGCSLHKVAAVLVILGFLKTGDLHGYQIAGP
eukprot:CAMPEP_0185780410 /NCGR_PEP_ID=MMETSP1174-20130828/99016_1 /TAXON_ID=35687 /ORGANISM="Dictyocha speculum, Strain CCMP1381" /LENGTH=158 /DNA_ID=CAMNT_0028469959 /DNA_START=47 /DNA_END=520 /DNA_ORIENTATION=+